MSAYPNSTRFASFAPARTRSPIGWWHKVPDRIARDPATIALAARIAPPGTRGAVATAVGVRVALVSFMAEDPGNDDGDVRRYAPASLALAVDWPGDPETFADALEDAGVTVDGRYRHWHELVGNPSPADRQRTRWRDAQRRRRERLATMTSDDSVIVPPVAYKVRAPESEPERHTPATSLRDSEDAPAPPDVPPHVPAPAPAPIAILESLWESPVPATAAKRVLAVVRDLDRWRRTCAAWEAAGWHRGPGALGALLDRYRQDVDRPRVAPPTRRRPAPGVALPDVPTFSPGTPPPSIVPPLPGPASPASREAFAQAFASSSFVPRARPAPPDRPVPARPVPDLLAIPQAERVAFVLAQLAARTVPGASP